MVWRCLIAWLSRRPGLLSRPSLAKKRGLICVGCPVASIQIRHSHPPGGPRKRPFAAGHNIEVLAETVRLVTDDDRSVVDPQPIKIRLVVQPETRRLLGCQAIGPKAAEIVNLAATALRTGLSVTQLADLAMVHPSASEALVRCLQSRFDRPALQP